MANASFCPLCGEMLAPDEYYGENGMLPLEFEHVCPMAASVEGATITDEMVERAARHLAINFSGVIFSDEWEWCNEDERQGWLAEGRAVLEAALAQQSEVE